MSFTPKICRTFLYIERDTVIDTMFWMLNCRKNLQSATSIICSTDISLLQKPYVNALRKTAVSTQRCLQEAPLRPRIKILHKSCKKISTLNRLWTRKGVRATVVTAGHCTHAELISGHALASCYSCCAHSLPGLC